MDDDSFEISVALNNKNINKEYIWIPEPTDGTGSLKIRDMFVYLLGIGWEVCVIIHKIKRVKAQSNIAKTKYVPHIFKCVICG